ncbi:hypothetical protein S83_050428 [Arachis hypogaea]
MSFKAVLTFSFESLREIFMYEGMDEGNPSLAGSLLPASLMISPVLETTLQFCIVFFFCNTTPSHALHYIGSFYPPPPVGFENQANNHTFLFRFVSFSFPFLFGYILFWTCYVFIFLVH